MTPRAHALLCKIGGAVVRRRNLAQAAVASQVAACLGVVLQLEQVMPAWGRDEVEARLEVTFRQDSGRTAFLDVAISHCLVADVVEAAAGRDGAAAANREARKHARYLGQRVTPLCGRRTVGPATARWRSSAVWSPA